MLIVGQLFSSEAAFGGDAYGVACCDIDRDGYYDVLTASDVGVNYYRNLDDNGFADPLLYPVDDSRAVLGGDLDGDGWIDMFVATLAKDFLFLNSGDNQNFDTTSAFFPDEATYAAALVDFDLDGDLDIFTAGALSRIYSNRTDSFVVLDSFPAGFAVAWGDYNSDSWPDFALAGSDSVYFYYYGNLTGEFIPDTAIELNDPRGLCWFDVEGDGELELAVADSAGRNRIVGPSASFAVDSVGTEIEPSIAVAAGNFDGQGGVDLIFINYGIEDRIYQGPDFGAGQSDTVSFGTKQSRTVAVADLDDANGLDMAMAGSGGNALYTSEVTSTSRIVLYLEGRGDKVEGLSNTIAAGARVTLYNEGSSEGYAEISAHSGQNSPQVSFAIPEVEGYLVEISWPRSQIVDSLPLDTFGFPVEISAFEDITPPEPPSGLTIVSMHEDTTRWWNEDDVSFSWTLGDDPHGSGVKGYSVTWSTDTTVSPDTTVEAGAEDGAGTFASDIEGDQCYFFIATVDRVGNTSIPVRSPALKLDFTDPDSTEAIAPVRQYLNDPLVRYEWTKGADTPSGVSTYTLEISSRPDFLIVDRTVSDIADTFYQSLDGLTGGRYYWRLLTYDSAGNSYTHPAQTGDTLGVWFVVDLTRPDTNDIIPENNATVVPPNTLINIIFDEQMLPVTALDEANYSLTYGPLSDTIEFSVSMESDSFTVVIDPTNPTRFPELSDIYVKMYNGVTDLAGNPLTHSIYAWSFHTTDALDEVKPRIDTVIITPNPTGGASQVLIEVHANDSAAVYTGLKNCVYYIDTTASPSITMRRASNPYPWMTIFTDTLMVDTFELNTNYTLIFRVQDNTGLSSDDKYVTLSVSNDVTPPVISLSPHDTSSYIGDTLELVITASEPLSELYVVFNQFDGDSLVFTRLDSVPISADSVNFTARIPLTGFPTGEVEGTVSGLDRSNNRGNKSFPLILQALSLLEPNNTFAAPNPASDMTWFYVIPGENVTAALVVYTIDGQEVWRSESAEVAGGERYSFETDVSDWPVGLYLFVAKVEHADGRQAVVKKAFAVLR